MLVRPSLVSRELRNNKEKNVIRPGDTSHSSDSLKMPHWPGWFFQLLLHNLTPPPFYIWSLLTTFLFSTESDKLNFQVGRKKTYKGSHGCTPPIFQASFLCIWVAHLLPCGFQLDYYSSMALFPGKNHTGNQFANSHSEFPLMT